MKRRDEVTVGILITVAVIVLILGTLWLARGGLRSGYPLYTRFAWGQNLKQGQPVLLAGVNVGYVGDVTLRRDGYLDVMLKINDQYSIPKGSNAAVKPVGIFGDVAIALTPPIPLTSASYASGDTVPPGPPAADFNQILTRMDTIGQTISLLSRSLQTELVEAGTLKDMHKVIVSATALSVQLQSVAAQQNRNLSAAVESFRSTASHFDTAVGKVAGVVDSAKIAATLSNVKTSSENLARISSQLDSSTTQLRVFVNKMENGNGTVQKLMTDSLMYTDARHLLQTIDSLVTDFKKNPKKYINLKIF
jgi:phospholipid/cholesterol/gamma-HCH transport system substrate-binding protein